MKKALLIVLASLALAACGFRLHGTFQLPPWFDRIYIENQGSQSNIAKTLKRLLRSNRVTVLPTSHNAAYLLILEKDKLRRQITYISASTTPRQYQLTYSINVRVKNAKGLELIPTSTLMVSRNLTVNNNRILGSNFEEGAILREMRQEAATQIMHVLAIRLNNHAH